MNNNTCQDCKGTGQYVGFLETRPCPTCNGTGRVGGVSSNRTPTGIAFLDQLLEGGLGPGQYGVIISRPGGGRTTMACHLAWSAALHGVDVQLRSSGGYRMEAAGDQVVKAYGIGTDHPIRLAPWVGAPSYQSYQILDPEGRHEDETARDLLRYRIADKGTAWITTPPGPGFGGGQPPLGWATSQYGHLPRCLVEIGRMPDGEFKARALTSCGRLMTAELPHPAPDLGLVTELTRWKGTP